MAYPERVVKAIARARAAMNAQQPEAAIADLEWAVNKYPKAVDAWVLLGQALGMLQRHGDAELALRRAVKQAPGNADAWFYLALALGNLDRHAEALTTYQRYTQVNPGPPPPNVIHNIASSLIALDMYSDAEIALEQLVTVKNTPDVWYLYGLALQGQDKHGQAREAYRGAIERGMRNFSAFLNCGACCHAMDDFEAAADYAQSALDASPGDPVAQRNLVLALAASGRIAEAVDLDARSEAATHRRQAMLVACLDSLAPEETRRVHEACAASYPRSLPPLAKSPEDGPGRPKVGFISGDFRNHPVWFFAHGLIDALDKSRLDVNLYSTVVAGDSYTEQTRSIEGIRWIDVAGQANEEIARRIRADSIELLFDLSGPTAAGVPGVLAMRAAPVQLSYIGYAVTTGLPEMDGYLTDEILDPGTDDDRYFTEPLKRLGTPFVSYSPIDGAPEAGPLPMLANGYPTFGSFTQLTKLTDASLALWAAAMNTVPSARLRLVAKGLGVAATEDRLLSRLAGLGISRDRVELHAALSLNDYFDAHRHIDLMLDTTPWNAHTTAMHGLSMGVPTISMRGDRHVARFGEMILRNLDLGELLAPSHAAYGETVARAVADPARLAELRAGLRRRMADSPLCDHAGMARRIEGLVDECLAAIGRR